jgi:hypothetical protein
MSQTMSKLQKKHRSKHCNCQQCIQSRGGREIRWKHKGKKVRRYYDGIPAICCGYRILNDMNEQKGRQ